MFGLRHLAYEVPDFEEAVRELQARGVTVGSVRIKEHTARLFDSLSDSNGLPLGLYERQRIIRPFEAGEDYGSASGLPEAMKRTNRLVKNRVYVAAWSSRG